MVQHELPSSRGARTGPVRTCLGCRQRSLTADLLRVVVQEVEPKRFVLVPDPERRLPGRGAWLHPESECLSQAERRRAFGRALRVPGNPDTAALDKLVGSGGENSLGGRNTNAVTSNSEKNRHEHS